MSEHRLNFKDHDRLEELRAAWRRYPHEGTDPFTDLDRHQLWMLCHDFAAYLDELDPLKRNRVHKAAFATVDALAGNVAGTVTPAAVTSAVSELLDAVRIARGQP